MPTSGKQNLLARSKGHEKLSVWLGPRIQPPRHKLNCPQTQLSDENRKPAGPPRRLWGRPRKTPGKGRSGGPAQRFIPDYHLAGRARGAVCQSPRPAKRSKNRPPHHPAVVTNKDRGGRLVETRTTPGPHPIGEPPFQRPLENEVVGARPFQSPGRPKTAHSSLAVPPPQETEPYPLTNCR